jgi:hypothetical protein
VQALGLFERDVQSADTVTRIAVDAAQTLFLESVTDILADVHAHDALLERATA